MAKSKSPAGDEELAAVMPDKEVSAIPPDNPPAPAGEEGTPPPFGSPEPAGDGPVPRVVGERVRAPKGLTRFKIRCDNYHPQPSKYILARDEDQARACYLKVTRLDQTLAKLEKNRTKDSLPVEPPALVVTELPD